MRNIIYKYQHIVYETEIFGEKDKNSFFAIDESLFGHRQGKQLWIIGAINTQSKEFRLEGVYERNGENIKKIYHKIYRIRQ